MWMVYNCKNGKESKNMSIYILLQLSLQASLNYSKNIKIRLFNIQRQFFGAVRRDVLVLCQTKGFYLILNTPSSAFLYKFYIPTRISVNLRFTTLLPQGYHFGYVQADVSYPSLINTALPYISRLPRELFQNCKYRAQIEYSISTTYLDWYNFA